MSNKNHNILLLVALPAELGEEATKILTTQCDICYTGVGKICAYESALAALIHGKYDIVINAGTCGSFRHSFATILCPSRVAQGDAYIGTDFATPEENILTGDSRTAIISGDNFIGENTPEEHRQLIAGYDCMDMESYAIVRATKFYAEHFNKVRPRIYMTKVVSDGADGSIGDWATRLEILRPTLLKAIQQTIEEAKKTTSNNDN